MQTVCSSITKLEVTIIYQLLATFDSVLCSICKCLDTTRRYGLIPSQASFGEVESLNKSVSQLFTPCLVSLSFYGQTKQRNVSMEDFKVV